MRNRYGLKADHWCNPTSTLKLSLSPAALRTFVLHVLYQLNIFFRYLALPHASPDLLPRYSIVGFLYIYEGDSYVLLAFSVFFDCLLKDEYRISGASSWHKSKLAFMNFRALSQPSVNHLLPYFEGVCEQFDASVILTLLNVTLFFENGDQNAVSPGRWYALSCHDSVEKFATCHHCQLSQAFPYLHWYLVAAHSLATLHPSQCSLCLCLTDWARHALVGGPVLGLHSWVLFIHEPADPVAL